MADETVRPAISRRECLLGLGGAVAVAGSAGESRAQTATGGGGTRTIDMTDDLVFAPDEVSVRPGTTVVWENVGAVGHSVTAYEEEIPGDAEYFASGGFDSEDAARSAYTVGDPESGDVAGGESYEHTFEVEGEYGYFCIPHESAGMVASLTVSPDAPPADGGDGGDGGGDVLPVVPDVAFAIGLAALTAGLATLALAYLFLKYGSGSGTAD
mgnify:FL=1